MRSSVNSSRLVDLLKITLLHISFSCFYNSLISGGLYMNNFCVFWWPYIWWLIFGGGLHSEFFGTYVSKSFQNKQNNIKKTMKLDCVINIRLAFMDSFCSHLIILIKLKIWESSIVSVKPGIISEKLIILMSSNYHRGKYFMLKFWTCSFSKTFTKGSYLLKLFAKIKSPGFYTLTESRILTLSKI